MDVRTQILAAALRAFAAKGYEATSLADVASAVAVRKQSLLYYFPSKEALRQAVLDALLARWNEVLPRLLLAATSGEDRFSATFRETVRFFAEDTDRARLLLREILDRPDAMRGELEAYVKPWVSVVAEYIHKGQAHGEVHPSVDAEAYVLCVINLVVSGVATAASLSSALLPPRAGQPSPAVRCQQELMRIARSSLFTGAGAAGAPSERRRTGRARPAPGPRPDPTTAHGSAPTKRRASDDDQRAPRERAAREARR
ncbi:MAG: TetR/AcrR family transcriptional regulator [Myxococcales bacterium]|nr:TetR/AcrR family transcriptional regulator [Myxococcales bacterium]